MKNLIRIVLTLFCYPLWSFLLQFTAPPVDSISVSPYAGILHLAISIVSYMLVTFFITYVWYNKDSFFNEPISVFASAMHGASFALMLLIGFIESFYNRILTVDKVPISIGDIFFWLINLFCFYLIAKNIRDKYIEYKSNS